MRFRVDRRTVKGVVMKDKTVYHPGANGWVNIDHPGHLAEIRRSPVLGDTLQAQLGTPTLMAPMAEGKHCPICGFNAWVWTVTCPRCGEALDSR